MFSRPAAIGIHGPPRVLAERERNGPGGEHLVVGLPGDDQLARFRVDALLGRDDPRGRLGQIDADPQVGLIAGHGRLAAEAGAVGHHDAEAVDAFLVDVDPQGAAFVADRR